MDNIFHYNVSQMVSETPGVRRYLVEFPNTLPPTRFILTRSRRLIYTVNGENHPVDVENGEDDYEDMCASLRNLPASVFQALLNPDNSDRSFILIKLEMVVGNEELPPFHEGMHYDMNPFHQNEERFNDEGVGDLGNDVVYDLTNEDDDEDSEESCDDFQNAENMEKDAANNPENEDQSMYDEDNQ